jgi:hypothetical protein
MGPYLGSPCRYRNPHSEISDHSLDRFFPIHFHLQLRLSTHRRVVINEFMPLNCLPPVCQDYRCINEITIHFISGQNFDNKSPNNIIGFKISLKLLKKLPHSFWHNFCLKIIEKMFPQTMCIEA